MKLEKNTVSEEVDETKRKRKKRPGRVVWK